MRYGHSQPPIGLWFLALAYLIFAWINSPNLLISIPVILYPIIMYRLFWIDNQPNVLFFGVIYQWINVSAQLIYSTFLGMSLNNYMKGQSYPLLFNYTETLSVIGIYAISFGIYFAIRKINIGNMDAVLAKYSPQKVLTWYMIISVIIYLSRAAIWGFPGLVQYFYFFFYVKWGFFLATFYIVQKRGAELRWVLYLFLMAEFILGLASFFAENFVNIIIYLLIGILSLQPKIKFYGYVLIVGMTIVLFNIAVLWTASKTPYRQFINNGTSAQAVVVSQSDAITKLFEIVSNINQQTYDNAIRDMVDRVGYIQYFDATLAYVPSVVPHQNGIVYAKAIEFFLVPRFLDPSKEALDDSKHTNKYTGLGLSGSAESTSFSLGTVADAYIDFGEVFMFVPLFLFGFAIGLFYRYFWIKSPNQVWSWILVGPFFLLSIIFGADTTKAIGFLLIYSFTMMLVKGRLIRFLDVRMVA